MRAWTEAGVCKPRELFAVRGYDFDKYRRALRERGISAPRPPRRRTRLRPEQDPLGRLTRLRLATRLQAAVHPRYERRADVHLGLLQLACALICHRRLVRSF